MQYPGLLSPKPAQMILFQEALERLVYHKSTEHSNLSISWNQIAPEQVIKLIRMKNKMFADELKSLVFQLLELVRNQNQQMKKQVQQCKNQMSLQIQQIVNVFPARGASRFMSSRMQNTRICINHPKQKGMECTRQQRNNNVNLQSQNYLYQTDELKLQKLNQILKQEIKNHLLEIKILKQQKYKVYEQNFLMQSKISELQNSKQQQNVEYAMIVQQFQREKRQLMHSIESLQLIIRSKQNSIQSLQNNVKLNKKEVEPKQDIDFGKLMSYKNSSQQLLKEDYRNNAFLNVSISNQYIKSPGIDSLKKQVSKQMTFQRLRMCGSKQRHILDNSGFEQGKRSRARTTNMKYNGKDLKSRSKQKTHFSKIEAQLNKLSSQIQTDIKYSTQNSRSRRI